MLVVERSFELANAKGPGSPGNKPGTEEPDKKKAASPGRYSHADEADKVPSTRIDSTKMAAVRPSTASMKAVRPSSASMAAAVPMAEREDVHEAVTAMPPPNHDAVTAPPPTPRASSASVSVVNVPKPPPLPPSTRMPAVRPGAGPDSSSVVAAAPAIPETKGSEPKKLESGQRPSQRPPAPSDPAFLLEDLDEGSIAFAFDALISDEAPASARGTESFDYTPVRELFAELAANHMRHVRDFMIDVKWGEVTRDWIHICVPPVRTLRRAAERLEIGDLGAALELVEQELEAANAVGGQLLSVDEKKRLLDAYEELVKILPQAFALDRDKTQREAVIVQALLLQVPDVRKVTIDKLHAAGLTSLTALFAANVSDMAHVAGIPESLAERIVARVQAYRSELQTWSKGDARAAEREKLAGLQGKLKQHHDEYEEAASTWGPDAKAKKRGSFLAREETWLAISVLLARFGDVDRLQGIEKVPFAERIAQLSEYLREAKTKYESPEG